MIAVIVKEIMYILTIGYKEKHVKTKHTLSDRGCDLLPACLSALVSILTEERWLQNILNKEWIGVEWGRNWEEWEVGKKSELGLVCKIRLF